MFSCNLCAIISAPLAADLDIANEFEKESRRAHSFSSDEDASRDFSSYIRLQLNSIITNYQQTEMKNNFTVKKHYSFTYFFSFYFDSISFALLLSYYFNIFFIVFTVMVFRRSIVRYLFSRGV